MSQRHHADTSLIFSIYKLFLILVLGGTGENITDMTDIYGLFT